MLSKTTKPESDSDSESEKPSVTLPGKVDRILPAVPAAGIPEKAQVSVEGADHLYKEIRIENTLQDEKGREVALKPGSEVQVTVEAPIEAVVPKEEAPSEKNQQPPKDKKDNK